MILHDYDFNDNSIWRCTGGGGGLFSKWRMLATDCASLLDEVSRSVQRVEFRGEEQLGILWPLLLLQAKFKKNKMPKVDICTVTFPGKFVWPRLNNRPVGYDRGPSQGTCYL